MRRLVVVFSVAVLGCASNSLPIENGSSTASTTGGTNGGTTGGTNGGTTGGTTSGGTTDGTTGGSTTGGSTTGGDTTGSTTGGTTGGPEGSPCKTACDCQVGLACFQGQCVAAPNDTMVYCCDNGCPDGQFCQGSDGQFGTCGGGMSGTTGGGGCMTACDCPTGEACFQGQCVSAPQGQLFCCDDAANCPGGQFCQASDGSFAMCGDMSGTTTGGTTGGTTMCGAVKCMSDSDCTMAGCMNGCSRRRGTCR